MKKRGRPPMDKANCKAFKMIRIDADVFAKIREAANQLEAELGFRPTITQTLRAMFSVRLKT